MHPSSFRRIYFGRLENNEETKSVPNNVLRDVEEYPFGSGYGGPNSELSTNAVQMVKDYAKSERIVSVPSIRDSRIRLDNENDAAKWVNKIVDDVNEMFK